MISQFYDFIVNGRDFYSNFKLRSLLGLLAPKNNLCYQIMWHYIASFCFPWNKSISCPLVSEVHHQAIGLYFFYFQIVLSWPQQVSWGLKMVGLIKIACWNVCFGLFDRTVATNCLGWSSLNESRCFTVFCNIYKWENLIAWF